jgi:DNA-binding NarL/FixJ family response regulator
VCGALAALPGNDIAELTSCELDVLALIGKGLSNKEIADEFCISSVTAKSHIGSRRDRLRLGQRYRRAALIASA